MSEETTPAETQKPRYRYPRLNDACWCGSGTQFIECHDKVELDNPPPALRTEYALAHARAQALLDTAEPTETWAAEFVQALLYLPMEQAFPLVARTPRRCRALVAAAGRHIGWGREPVAYRWRWAWLTADEAPARAREALIDWLARDANLSSPDADSPTRGHRGLLPPPIVLPDEGIDWLLAKVRPLLLNRRHVLWLETIGDARPDRKSTVAQFIADVEREKYALARHALTRELARRIGWLLLPALLAVGAALFVKPFQRSACC